MEQLDPFPVVERGASCALHFRGTAYRSPKLFRSGTHRAQSPADTLSVIKPYLAQAGITRIADVTGLDNVGVPTTLAIRPNALTIACSSGKGLTLDQAYVSGAMEGFELYAAETASVASSRATYRQLSEKYNLPDSDDLPLTRHSLFSVDWPFHWHFGWDLLRQCETPVPAAMVGMSRNSALVTSLGAFQVSSNGLGAGNTFLEAVSAGLYECIERDAVACHFHAAMHRGNRIPTVPEITLNTYPLVRGVVEHCRRAGVRVVVHDCTSDTNVPTYTALVFNEVDRGVGVVRGSGTHLDPEVAILRAITEALQARLNFIAGSRDDIFRTAFVRARADWGQAVAAIAQEQQDPLLAMPRQSRASDTFEDDISDLLRCVSGAGAKTVALVNLTPAHFPIHVVRVIILGFEGYMHHGYRPGARARRYLAADLHES